jgi:hypothetical protein
MAAGADVTHDRGPHQRSLAAAAFDDRRPVTDGGSDHGQHPVGVLGRHQGTQVDVGLGGVIYP